MLGAGALASLRENRSPAPWVAAAAVADGADAIAALAVGDAIPASGRWATVVLAGALAGMGLIVAQTLE